MSPEVTPGLAQRQADLVDALLASTFNPPGPEALVSVGPRATVWRGLQAYRSNAHAVAERALQAAFPVLAQLIGEEPFAMLSRALWHTHPASRGDLGQWGAQLPDFVRAAPQLADLPYLADVAAAEWHLHTAATAADGLADPASLQQFLAEPPETITLVLAPGTALVASGWPVVSLLQAHAPLADPDWAELGRAVRERRPQTALVWREGLRPRCREASLGEAALISSALQGASLLQAVTEAAIDPEFSLNDWLPAAWHSGLLLALRRVAGDPHPQTQASSVVP